MHIMCIYVFGCMNVCFYIHAGGLAENSFKMKCYQESYMIFISRILNCVNVFMLCRQVVNLSYAYTLETSDSFIWVLSQTQKNLLKNTVHGPFRTPDASAIFATSVR